MIIFYFVAFSLLFFRAASLAIGKYTYLERKDQIAESILSIWWIFIISFSCFRTVE